MVPEQRDRPARRIADVQLRGGVHARVYWPEPSGTTPALLVLFAAGYSVPGVVVLATCPDTVEQAVATAEWAADHPSELDATAAPLLVGGDPELANAVVEHAREHGWPAVELFSVRADEFQPTRTS
ncbi:MAG TPA: hypothetical protein VH373_08715 [Jatrophihabitantaceae bacterium]|jgi:hypothetical protein